MARYSLNFGKKLQMMFGIGKECGFRSNFDMPRSFTPRKSELRSKIANSQSDCRAASCIPEKRKSNELTLGTRLNAPRFWAHLIEVYKGGVYRRDTRD